MYMFGYVHELHTLSTFGKPFVHKNTFLHYVWIAELSLSVACIELVTLCTCDSSAIQHVYVYLVCGQSLYLIDLLQITVTASL